MGKSKNRKTKQHRPRPTGVPSLKELEENEEMSATLKDADAIDDILEKLLSTSTEDKVCSAAFITQSANSSSFVKLLIERNIVKIAAPFIVNSNPSVSRDMAACLRALSVCGGPLVSEAMVEQDVMTPVTTFIKQFFQGFDLKKLQQEKHSAKKDAFHEVCGLLTSLCENCSAALDIFNKNMLISSFLPYLKVDDKEILFAVVQCLQTVTENNMNALKILSEVKNQEALQSLLSPTPAEPIHLHIRALVAGILFNSYSCKVVSNESSAANSIVKVIEETLDIPIKPEIDKISQAVCCPMEEEGKEEDAASLGKREAEFSKLVRCVDHILMAKQVALEILTNICSSDDSCDMDEDESSSSLSDDPTDLDGFYTEPVYLSPVFSIELNNIIAKKKLLQKLPLQIVILDEPLKERLEEITEAQEILKRFHTVRCRALFCANNVIQALDVEDLGGPAELFKLWMDMSTLMFTRTDSNDQEQMEAAVSSVRAVLQKLGETDGVASQFGQMTESDVKLFFDIYHKTESASIKANILRCVATIGCILGNMTQPNSYNLIKLIGTFLTETCTKCPELWVTAEALDALFDVFAEDHLDDIAREISLIEKLSTLTPVLKSKIKQQKNSLGEHLPIIMTAKTNLLRFLKYKNKLM